MASGEKHTDIQFPLSGIDTSDAFDRQQPKASPIGTNKTTPRAVNVRSFEALTRRGRGGSRPGLVKYLAEPVGG